MLFNYSKYNKLNEDYLFYLVFLILILFSKIKLWKKKKCPQCKNLILKTSPTCLYCGRPNKFITKEYVNKKWNKGSNKNEFDYIFINKYLVFILFLIITIVFILFG